MVVVKQTCSAERMTPQQLFQFVFSLIEHITNRQKASNKDESSNSSNSDTILSDHTYSSKYIYNSSTFIVIHS